MKPSEITRILDRAIEYLLILTVMTSAIAFSYDTTKMFMVAKETLNQILIAVTFGVWITRMMVARNFAMTLSAISLPVGVFLALNAISIHRAESTYLALRDFWILLNYVLIFFLVLNNLKRPRRINMLVSVVVLTAAINGVYGMMQAAGIDPLFSVRETGRAKIFGFFGNPNFLAGFLNICLPISVATLFLPDRRYQVLGLVATPFSVMGLFVTLTRSEWIAFTCSTLFFIFLLLAIKVVQPRKLAIVAAAGACTLLIAWTGVRGLDPGKMRTDVRRITARAGSIGDATQFNARQRFMMWKMCMKMVQSSPVFGVGIGNFKQVFFDFQARWYASHVTEVDYQGFGRIPKGDDLYEWYKDVAVSPIRAHNEYFQYAAELGIPGLAVFLWMMAVFFIRGWKVLSEISDAHAKILYAAILSSIFAVLVSSIFNFPFRRPEVAMLFWFLMGVASLPAAIFANWRMPRYYDNKELLDAVEIDGRYEDNADLPVFGAAATVAVTSLIIFFVVRLHVANTLMKDGLNIQLKAGQYDAAAARQAAAGKTREANELAKTAFDYNQLAVDRYKRSLDYDPNFGETHFRLGQTYQAMKNIDGAIAAYIESLKNIQSKYTYFSMGAIYQELGEIDKAITWYKKLLDLMPAYVQGHFNLGYIYLSVKNEPLSALYHWNEILSPSYWKEVSPGMVQKVHFNVAEVCRKLGDSESALYHYAEVLKIEPDSRPAAHYSAELVAQLFR